MHAFVVSHTGIQPQSNMAVLQALQMDDANSLLAAVHMHDVDSCYSILHQRELHEFKQLQDCREKWPLKNSLPLGHTETRTSPAFGAKPKRNKHHRHSRPSRSIQTSTQGILWPPQPHPAAYLPMEVSMGPRPGIRTLARSQTCFPGPQQYLLHCHTN